MIIAALLMVIHITFAGVLVLQKDAQPIMKWIFEIIFLKHANDGITQAIFGYTREKMECDEIYCHFQNPEKFLKMIDSPSDATNAIFAFPLIFIVVHAITFFNMNNRLKSTD